MAATATKTPDIPVDGVPEIVRDSQLQVESEKQGHDEFIIHTRTARRRHSAQREKWMVERHLRAGGQGTVYLHSRVGGGEPGQPTVRAVKRIPVRDLGPAIRSKIYHRELETIAKFSLAKYAALFVTSYGWYILDGSVHITMEYCELGDLSRHIQNREVCPLYRLPERDTQEITSQVLEALATMHEEGFCHRDLKLANILIKSPGPNWWVKVADFGLSRRESNVTVNAMAGSHGYMPPELLGFKALGDNKVDHFAADMWSLGQVVSKLVTGQVLFPLNGDVGQYYFGYKGFPEDTLRQCDVSDDLIDFVKSLACVVPSHRLTTETAMLHPWMMPLHNGPSIHVSQEDDGRIPEDQPSNVWPDGLGSTTEETQASWGDPSTIGGTSFTADTTHTTNDLAEDHKDAGNLLFKDKKYDLALKEYSTAVELDPSSPVYLSNRAATRMAMFLWEDALEDCMKALSLGPPAPKLRLRQGRIYTRLGRPEEALSVYETIHSHVTDKDLNRAKAMANAIDTARECLDVKQAYSSALEWLDQAKSDIGTNASTPRAWLLMEAEAKIGLRQQRGTDSLLDEASTIVESLLQKNYQDTEALYLRHRIAVSRTFKPATVSDDNDATEHTEEPAKPPPAAATATEEPATTEEPPVKEPTPAESNNEGVHKSTEESERCVAEIERVKKLGNDAYKKHEFAKALEIYSDALAICADERQTNARLYQNRAQVYIRLGEYNKAIVDCDGAIMRDASYEKPYETKKRAEELIEKRETEEKANKKESGDNTADAGGGGQGGNAKDPPPAEVSSDEPIEFLQAWKRWSNDAEERKKEENAERTCPLCHQEFESREKLHMHKLSGHSELFPDPE